MTTQFIRNRVLVVGVVAAALATGAGGALASVDDRAGYATAELVQLGHGPAGPPAVAPVSRAAETAGAAGRAYGSAETVQLGHGPGGPRAPEAS